MTILYVHTKANAEAGLICRIYQYYMYTAASDCQTTSGHDSRRSAWGTDRWLWTEKVKYTVCFLANGSCKLLNLLHITNYS